MIGNETFYVGRKIPMRERRREGVTDRELNEIIDWCRKNLSMKREILAVLLENEWKGTNKQ